MKSMTLAADEFIRRFLLHVLPDGFQRIRHYGFLANGHRRAKLVLIRRLLAATPPPTADKVTEHQSSAQSRKRLNDHPVPFAEAAWSLSRSSLDLVRVIAGWTHHDPNRAQWRCPMSPSRRGR
jgi:Putative transposase